MALFDNIRSKTDTTTARVLFAAVVVVFVFSFINMGFGGQTVTYAKVNGNRITDIDLQKRMRLVQRQQNISSLNEDEMEVFKEEILEELIIQKSVLDRAKDLHVEVSDTEVNVQILNSPGFKDASGEFSEELYGQAVKQEGFGSKTKFEEKIRQDIAYSKLRDIVTNGVYVSEDEAKKKAEMILTSMTIEWIRLSKGSLKGEIAISDADITTEIESNKEGLEAEYAANLEIKYKKPVRVDLERIVLAIEDDNKPALIEKANTIIKSINDGGSFAASVKEHSADTFNDGRLVNATEMQLPAEVASKLFIDSPSKDLQIVETDKSVQIIRLIGKKEAFTKTFDDVKQDLAKESLMKKKTEQAIKTKAAEVLQAWKTELTTPVLELEEEQEAPEEEVVSILSQYQKVLSEPFSPVAPELPGAGNAPELLEALSEVTETGILETAYATTGGYLVVRVVSYQEPKEEELKRFTQQVKMSLAQTFKANTWTAFEVQSRNEASVEEIWKARKN
jgi:peptidyl-prolyl cis-trans isomerase D